MLWILQRFPGPVRRFLAEAASKGRVSAGRAPEVGGSAPRCPPRRWWEHMSLPVPGQSWCVQVARRESTGRAAVLTGACVPRGHESLTSSTRAACTPPCLACRPAVGDSRWWWELQGLRGCSLPKGQSLVALPRDPRTQPVPPLL